MLDSNNKNEEIKKTRFERQEIVLLYQQNSDKAYIYILHIYIIIILYYIYIHIIFNERAEASPKMVVK